MPTVTSSLRPRCGLAALLVAAVAGCGGGDSMGPPDGDGDGAGESVTVTADRDNTIYEDPAGGFSNGAGTFLFVGVTNNGLIRRALVRFDLAAAGVPAGATVDSVRLRLNLSRTIVTARPVSLHRVTADWGEGTSDAGGAEGMGAAATAGDATWIHRFFDTDLWSAPGGDFIAGASATIQAGADGPHTWGSTPQMVADVRGWIADAASNFGWILIGDESASRTAKRFDSREGSAANRPALTIFFTRP
jgi:hypothetical protein